jgi:hypothetical protein
MSNDVVGGNLVMAAEGCHQSFKAVGNGGRAQCIFDLHPKLPKKLILCVKPRLRLRLVDAWQLFIKLAVSLRLGLGLICGPCLLSP